MEKKIANHNCHLGPLGVSIEFIRKYIADNNINVATLTTTDVCNTILKPQTLDRKSAYIELVKGQKDGNGKPYVGPATVFVSHAWKYKFGEPVDVMEQHAKRTIQTPTFGSTCTSTTSTARSRCRRSGGRRRSSSPSRALGPCCW